MPDINRPATSEEQPLDSWKEIAAYLNRDERTARRWEKTEGLPVHRHQHLKRQSVFAYRTEIDAWRQTRSPKGEETSSVRQPLWRHKLVSAATVVLGLLFAVWVVKQGPILSPADPLVQAADAGDGILVRQIWAEPGTDHTGSPSPDGKLLSFTHWDTYRLALRDLQTGKARFLTESGETAFPNMSVISPDGRRVAYGWLDDDPSKQNDLRVIGIEGQEGGATPQVIYKNSEVAAITPRAWFSDGDRILAEAVKKDRSRQILVVALDGTAPIVLKSFGWDGPRQLSVSPDGRFIAYSQASESNGDNTDIFVLASDGSTETALVEHPSNDRALGWMPNGRHLLFATDRSGKDGLWAQPVKDGRAAGEPIVLRSDLGVGSPLGFTSDGTFFFGVRNGARDIHVAELDIETGKLIAPPKPAIDHHLGSNRLPRWSPDGKQLAYVTSRKHQGETERPLVIRSLETGLERVLPVSTEYPTWLTWSRDGQRLAVSGGMNRRGIVEVDPESGQAHFLFGPEEGKHIQNTVAWSRDGREIYYVVRPDNKLFAFDRKSGESRELPGYPGGRFALSPDGTQLAAVEWGESRLYTFTLADGRVTDLLQLKAPEQTDYPMWSLDGRYILFWKTFSKADGEPERPAELWRVSAHDGSVKQMDLTASGLPQGDIHPDGRHIAFMSGQSRFEIWMARNLLPETTIAATE